MEQVGRPLADATNGGGAVPRSAELRSTGLNAGSLENLPRGKATPVRGNLRTDD